MKGGKGKAEKAVTRSKDFSFVLGFLKTVSEFVLLMNN